MSDNTLLILAMADECLEVIAARKEPSQALPPSLRPQHLEWMCRKLSQHAQDWPATKVQRWIGFVQAGMIANHLIDLAQAKEMFEAAKNAYGEMSEDLVDHLDPDSSFEVDLGGQG